MYILQGRKKRFYGGRGKLSRNFGHHGWQATKKLRKKKNWLKRPRAVPQNRNSDQNINDSFRILFLKILLRAYNAFIFAHTFQWTSSEFFFNFQIFQQKVAKPTKTSKKDHSFHNTVSLKKPHSF